MDIIAISTWAKTSIPGIILLGAFGSILALVLLKILKWVGSKLIDGAVRCLTPMMRGYFIAQLMGHRIESESKEHLVFYYMDMLLDLTLSTAMLSVFTICTIMYFIVNRFTASLGGIVLLSLSFASLYLWARAVFFFGTVREHIVGKGYDEYYSHLRKKVPVKELEQMVEALPERKEKDTPNGTNAADARTSHG